MCLGNADFNAGPHVVQFAINTTMASFNISITVENILEIDENFMFEIDPAMLIPQVFLGNISQASGLIIDDDRKCSNYYVNTYLVLLVDLLFSHNT